MGRSKKLQFGVIGNPISHSKSPQIHQQFAKQFNIELEYHAIRAEANRFVETVEEFRSHQGLGLNVTVPFKLDAFDFADNRSERARLAGAVNTLKFVEAEPVFGDNTDGTGLYRDLVLNWNCTIASKRLLVLGAGGAVRGVLAALLEDQPQCVLIANRTEVKAIELAQLFVNYGDVAGCGYDSLNSQQFDVVINGTAASLQGEVPPLPKTLFAKDALAYDMMYANRPTAFMRWAAEQGANQVVDGTGMLVEQAAESFFVWHGVRPKTAPVIQTLR
ncbi:shikimate dehydrogenase [Pseudomonadota bacterium]